jgi:itaconyl-CoA hydratase
METTSSEPEWSTVRVWRRGRRYGGFAVDQGFVHHWGRTITEADAVLFATQTLAHNPLYLNREWARSQGHPALVVSPYLVLAVVVGLSVEDLSEHSEAFLGMGNVRFREPVYPGDTLTATSRVISVRDSNSRPGHGIVTWSTEGRNHRGDVVVELTRSNLFRATDASD